MSDTPRTDAVEYEMWQSQVGSRMRKCKDGGWVFSDFARDLERENAALREAGHLAEKMIVQRTDEIRHLERENDALRKHLAEMRSMFHDMADRFGCPEFKTYLFDDFIRMKRELLRETAYPARAKEGGAT